VAQTGSRYDQRDVILTEVHSVTRTKIPAAKPINGDEVESWSIARNTTGGRDEVEVGFDWPEGLLGAVPLEGEA
jgi:hypothetical protein